MDERLVRKEFVKYTNDLFFHYLMVNNEKIRTLFCQELVPDKDIISTTVQNEKRYGKQYREKNMILDLVASDEKGNIYNIEMQTYGLGKDIMIRFQLYGADLLRHEIKSGKSYQDVQDVRQMIINAANDCENCHEYKHHFVLYDKDHNVEYPFNKLHITLIQLKHIPQNENMSVFDQLMYLFHYNRTYDKIKTDQLVKEAITMHDDYISSDENYYEYFDRIDNDMMKHSILRRIQDKEEALDIKEKEISIEKKELANKKEELDIKKEELDIKEKEIKEQQQDIEKEKTDVQTREENLNVKEENLNVKEENLKEKEKNLQVEKKNLKARDDNQLLVMKKTICDFIREKFHQDISSYLETLTYDQVFDMMVKMYTVHRFDELV